MTVYHTTLTITGDFSPVFGMHVIADSPAAARAYILDRFKNYPLAGLPEASEKHIRRAQCDATIYGAEAKATRSTVGPENADNYFASA